MNHHIWLIDIDENRIERVEETSNFVNNAFRDTNVFLHYGEYISNSKESAIEFLTKRNETLIQEYQNKISERLEIKIEDGMNVSKIKNELPNQIDISDLIKEN